MTTFTPAQSRRRMAARGQLAGSALCFGLMAILARKLTMPDMGFTAGHLAVLRFVVGALFSLLTFGLIPGLYRPSNHRLLVMRGLSGGAVVVLYFYALAHIPAGEAGILYNVFPVIAVTLSLVIFKERPTIHLWLAILAASLGVAMVLSQGHLGFGFGRGQLAALAAAVFAATSANAIRAVRHTDNAATIFFFFCIAGLPVVLPFALTPWPGGVGPWALAVLMSLLAYAGQLLMSEAYGTLSVPEAAIWLQLLPIVQYLLAVPLLGERSTLPGLAGVLITVAGVAYGTVLGHRQRA
ncbi:MAG: EamA family transporter [Geothrix sp.]|uniref:DMT family transporter n=1 Tax=Geothrix sp. TaxID=1962974 RepID=UPI001859D60A|nr:DMT family transporter [Geothrix sp.]NWJ42320.1 EamA family transporter [Geothrix sp.]WIL19712.1 MAG: DMT family transporter [Geothrix sp.]